jgi:hypothetical protein
VTARKEQLARELAVAAKECRDAASATQDQNLKRQLLEEARKCERAYGQLHGVDGDDFCCPQECTSIPHFSLYITEIQENENPNLVYISVMYTISDHGIRYSGLSPYGWLRCWPGPSWHQPSRASSEVASRPRSSSAWRCDAQMPSLGGRSLRVQGEQGLCAGASPPPPRPPRQPPFRPI